MKLQDFILKYLNKEDSKPRQKGRYWASELYSMSKGYITPKNFFKPSKVDKHAAGLILAGEAFESQLEKILSEGKANFKYNPKKELKITDDITLVVKPDFLFPTFAVETKYPFHKVVDKIPEKWLYQLESEYRAYKLPVYLWVFEYPFAVKAFPYTPSLRRWNNIKKLLVEFDSKLEVEK